MDSKAKVLGHSIHPMLIVFPLGLLATSFIFDIIRVAGGAPAFGYASFYMIAAGVIGGLIAAVFGLVDWLAIPKGSRARIVGAYHGGGNVLVVGLFIISWALRNADPGRIGLAPFLLSLAGVLLAGLTGWLGGELVERLGVGVHEGAHPNAPNSLSNQPASEQWKPPRPMRPQHA